MFLTFLWKIFSSGSIRPYRDAKEYPAFQIMVDHKAICQNNEDNIVICIENLSIRNVMNCHWPRLPEEGSNIFFTGTFRMHHSCWLIFIIKDLNCYFLVAITIIIAYSLIILWECWTWSKDPSNLPKTNLHQSSQNYFCCSLNKCEINWHAH